MRVSRSGFFRLSRCLSYNWAHIKYSSSWCVCTRVYKYTHTHHPNTRKNREIYKTNTLSLPLSKHGFPRQQQALTMNKLEKNSTSNPPPHMHACAEKTPVIHTHVVEGLGSTNKQNAPTRVHTYTHTHVHINVYAYTYTDTHICIYIHMHMHIYTHTYTHIYTYMYTHIYTQTEDLSNDASTRQRIS